MWILKFLCSEHVSLEKSPFLRRGGMRLICSVLLASALVAPVAYAQEPNDDENEHWRKLSLLRLEYRHH